MTELYIIPVTYTIADIMKEKLQTIDNKPKYHFILQYNNSIFEAMKENVNERKKCIKCKKLKENTPDMF